MEDWIYDNIVKLFIALISVVLVGMFISVKDAQEDHDKLIVECMADGKKHYECEAMFASHKSAVPVPMPVIVPAGR